MNDCCALPLYASSLSLSGSAAVLINFLAFEFIVDPEILPTRDWLEKWSLFGQTSSNKQRVAARTGIEAMEPVDH